MLGEILGLGAVMGFGEGGTEGLRIDSFKEKRNCALMKGTQEKK